MKHGAAPDARRAPSRDCAHCGLPVPAAEVAEGAALQFCCAGCRAVHGALHECGLADYYALRDAERSAEPAADAAPAQVTGRGFEHFDEEGFLSRHRRARADGLASIELRVEGIHCGACVWLLEAMPRVTAGVASVRIDSARGTARITWDAAAIPLSRIARAFDRLGYQLLPFVDPEQMARERSLDRAWFVRIGVAGAIATNAMAIAFALYGGLLSEMSLAYRLYFQWMSVALAVVALVGPGRTFFANAIAAVRTRTPHMDVPVAFGLFAAVVAGVVATVVGHGSIYCESASMLVFLLLVGRFVQYRRQRRAREQVELLLSIVPAVARRVVAEGGVERVREVSAESLAPGDVVDIPAGEPSPADGRLLGATAHFDLSHLTGESQPVRIDIGGPVYAGARAIGAPARVEVQVAGSETRAARLLELVRDASERRAPVVELANRIAGWFLVAVLALAAGTIAFWWPRLPAEETIARAVALLVVTCPCALGLATPLAVVAGIGKGARRGVLVKGGDILERAARPGTLVLDKTGTVTEGRTEVVDAALAEGLGGNASLGLAAALESRSVHPLARAIVERFGGEACGEASDVHEVPGRGIEGRVGKRLVRVGSIRFLEERGTLVPDEIRARSVDFAARGLAPVFVAVNGRAQAVLAIGDPVRSDARETISRLRRAGWRVVLASGDHQLVASSVAHAVGIDGVDAHGGLSPEDKLEFVRRTDLARPVLMVGDGVNDLAALAAADVGIAVRNGSQASHHVADVCLAARGLRPLERFVEGARSTMRAIRVNLVISIAYNALGGALAFAGLVNPLVAAILMPLSGLTVLVLAMRIPSFEIADGEGVR